MKTGVYKHFKGNKYKVIGIAKHSESEENHVIYHALNTPNELWIRPLEMFNEKVMVDGVETKRFEILEHSQTFPFP